MSLWPAIAASGRAKGSRPSPTWTESGANEIASVHAGDAQARPSPALKVGSEDDLLMANSGTELLPRTIIDIPGEEEGASGEADRQQWSHPAEFLMSCVSLSVGLGNIWRFPMTAYENGGGAFLIPYFVVLTFIGRPLYFMELAVGQFSSSGSVKVWKMVPAVKGVGYGQMVGTWSVVTYYCSLMAITLFYLFQSFSSELPWASCDPAWADGNCVDDATNVSLTAGLQSSSEQYFYNYVLNYSSDISNGIGLPDWRLSLCLGAAWLLLFLTLAKGVQSSGKVAYFTALFPYLVLLTLLVRGTTLPGAFEGVIYFVKPEWNRLLDPKVWYAAVTQSFFSLSVGFGSIITFSSYNNFNHNIYRDAWIISLVDTITSVLAGVTIFSILGHSAHHLGVDIKEVVRGGAGLAFISYPDALAKFTWAPQLFAVLFFLMLLTLGVGSAAALTSNVITIVCDQFPKWKKVYVTLAVCISGFLIGLVYVTPGGQWILELVDYFGGGFIIYVLVIIETVAIMYCYGMSSFVRDVKVMLDLELGIYWKFCWLAFIPVSLSGILAYVLLSLELPTMDGLYYPMSAYACGWALAGVALVMVPMGFLHAFYIADEETLFQRVKSVLRPKSSWGPKAARDRKGWLAVLADDP
ncbi:sodium-dependent nutrient amino acid transporter 1-like [Penaeus japonicus]|uniref:sodium-dependent nutrient amino acid transporter 1-like n=1 Tax=Penaeus japonicus TaxID=27405 RepID=UPI001C714018|nr:sodium-dependent nutrient amino acid transporter 1-like [Penaeus japonicus]XP_042883252.1 sodium-dependent nutrient amino acid transporter 1-like [Penaeus japonicus]